MPTQLRRVRDCDFRPLDEPGAYQRPFCGYVVHNITVLPIRKNCEVRTAWALGNRVERMLFAIGLTKPRWTRWLIFIHVLPQVPERKECNSCELRQEKLNRLGDWLLLKYWSFRGWLSSLLTP